MRRRMGCLPRLLLLGVLVCVLVGAWALVEPYLLATRQDAYAFSDLPPAFDGLRVAFLADIHWGPRFSDQRMQDLVARVNALMPDVIVLGGDYADDSNGAVEFFRRRPAFSAPLGVYAIPGNHDRVMPESNRRLLAEAMRGAGVTPLFNAVFPVERNGQFLYIAGVDDYSTGHPDIGGVAGSLYKEDFVLLLSHDPDSLPAIHRATDARGQTGWADLILCGHTHAGQVNFGPYSPMLRRVVHNTQYRYGAFYENGSRILVTSGVGTTVLPLRLMARPEIRLITLRRGEAS